jgi:ubiquinone/menaquinone biosynthesis C-methylase UbiE
MRRGDYGYDAPHAPFAFTAVGLFAAVRAILSWQGGDVRHTILRSLFAAFFFGNALSYLYATRRGKFIEWERILERLQLRGDEQVLDLGCGRGAVLTAVARRLTTGRVTGVDIWDALDQSGNAREATERNASLEGVAERISVETGDMRKLPFADATFDLIVSSLAIHNIRGNAGRRQAIAEGYRVLKPGGRLVIADIRATAVYADALRRLGATQVARHRLGWRFWYGNPIAHTKLVTASKSPS